MGKKNANYIETECRLNEMLNVAERFVRTERHLEQHSDISKSDQVHHAQEVQSQRIEDINNLKDKIIFGDGGPTNEVKNINKNIAFGEGYLKHNGDHMNPSDKKNLEENIQNRKDKINELKGDTNYKTML
ncbi:MAG: hypothetical protein AB6733_12600 [Clostridiaceae bacterium]